MARSASGHAARMAASNTSDSMNKSPMIAILRGIAGSPRRLHGAPDRPHGFARFQIDGEAAREGRRDLRVRQGALAEQRGDPFGRRGIGMRVDALLDRGGDGGA